MSQKKIKWIALSLGFFTFFEYASALDSSRESALRLRHAIEIKPSAGSFNQKKSLSTYVYQIPEKVILPVSRGFDQSGTELCWAYAFFNALETIYLGTHPGAILELSRGAMQYITIEDRLNLKILGEEDHITERGSGPDAASLIAQFGIVQFGDYHDVIRHASYSSLVEAIFSEHTIPEQLSKLANTLPVFFTVKVPEETTFEGQKLTSLEFAKNVLGSGEWRNFGVSKTEKEYIAKDPDPDRRHNGMTYFIPKEQIINKIKHSLAKGIPVLFADANHVVLLYGAEYNELGNPVRFYIKDSYGPSYFYQADVKKAFALLEEITLFEEESKNT